ncbi:MAG TPA: hypothetical protein P5055_23285, partial [Candidatus Paceibacterota bacterium]|nr:hypothetical protein [Candidatus Paceibacterota bacterium]
MNRRDFLKTTSGAIAMGPLAAAAASATESPSGTASAGANKYATVRVDKDRIRVETHTLSAVFIKGFLTSLKCRSTGEEFIQGVKPDTSAALELIYRSDERVPVDLRKYGSIVTHPVSDQSAEIVFNSWDGDGVILVSADPETGSLWVEPSAFSSRPGVRACRWNLEGLRSDLNLV